MNLFENKKNLEFFTIETVNPPLPPLFSEHRIFRALKNSPVYGKQKMSRNTSVTVSITSLIQTFTGKHEKANRYSHVGVVAKNTPKKESYFV